MRLRDLIAATFIPLWACAREPASVPKIDRPAAQSAGRTDDGNPETVRGTRFSFMLGGSKTNLVILPSKKVYCLAMWSLVAPVSIGSNPFYAVVRGRRGTQLAAQGYLEERGVHLSRLKGHRVHLPVGVAREVVALTQKDGWKILSRAAEKSRWMEHGLLPNLLDLEGN